MKKFVSFAFAAAVAMTAALPSAAVAAAEEAAPAVSVSAGQVIYDAKGYRIAAVYRVTAEGDPQVIINGRLLTVSASTLSVVDGKLTTSLTKREVVRGG